MFGPAMDNMYEICLCDLETVLPELAKVIGAKYESGSFDSAEENFHASGKDSLQWVLQGLNGLFSVTLEKYEGYYFSQFNAPEPEFGIGKQLLWEHYLKIGGNPDAQEMP